MDKQPNETQLSALSKNLKGILFLADVVNDNFALTVSTFNVLWLQVHRELLI